MFENNMDEGKYLPASEEWGGFPVEEAESSSVVADALQMAANVIDIVNNYDIRNITPAEMRVLSGRLFDVGAIGVSEYAAMSFQPSRCPSQFVMLESYLDMSRNPDKPRDFIAEWEHHLSELQKRRPEPFSLTLTRQIVDLLQSFEPLEDDEAE